MTFQELKSPSTYINNQFNSAVAGRIINRTDSPRRTTVDIIIPVYNARELTERCIASVQENSCNCRLIIVNDASGEPGIMEFLDSLRSLPQKQIEVIVCHNEVNLGFLKTVNDAYSLTQGHFVILNSDTEVPPGWLDRLFAPILAEPEIVASVTPFTNASMGWLGCNFPDPEQDGGIFKNLTVASLDSFFARYSSDIPIEIFSGCGFCMAFNRAVVEKIGLFDHETFGRGYCEEVDWSLRAVAAGYRNVLAPNLFVFHKHGVSFDPEEKQKLQDVNLQKLRAIHGVRMERTPMSSKDMTKPICDNIAMIVEAYISGANESYFMRPQLRFSVIASLESLMSSMHKVLLFVRQSVDTHSHGGCRRTAQLVYALSDLDFGLVVADNFQVDTIPKQADNSIVRFFHDYSQYLKNRNKEKITSGVYGKWSVEKRDYLLRLNSVAAVWQNALLHNRHLKLAIVDDPIYFAPLIDYLYEQGIPIIAHCHNIETLSASQVIPEYQRELFAYELDLLAKCKKVVIISREESFLLQNLGMESIYIPYYPVKEIKERLSAVRNCRKTTVKKDILLLGSVGNLPTMNGMKTFIKAWSDMVSNDGFEDRLIVAGFGTEEMQEYATCNRVVFRGVLSDNELDHLLSQVKAAVVYQENGSGALTKICEFLLAGVPVLANQHAARSYYNLPGVFEFRSVKDIPVIIQRITSDGLKVAEPDEPDYSELLSFVKAQL